MTLAFFPQSYTRLPCYLVGSWQNNSKNGCLGFKTATVDLISISLPLKQATMVHFGIACLLMCRRQVRWPGVWWKIPQDAKSRKARPHHGPCEL